MRLVQTAEIGAVERDEAVRKLTERATLTRMVCREVLESNNPNIDRRPQVALFALLSWIVENHRQHIKIEPRAYDGLRHTIAPEGYTDLLVEIEAGTLVCHALFMLFTYKRSKCP